jgi:hypothetical protein
MIWIYNTIIVNFAPLYEMVRLLVVLQVTDKKKWAWKMDGKVLHLPIFISGSCNAKNV